METLSFFGKSSSFVKTNTQEAWQFFESGQLAWEVCSIAQKDVIVRHYAPQIRFLALRMRSRLPKNIELNELISAGSLGLIEALKKFKSDVGVKFQTYAENRIRGAMLDELRRLDWFPRGLRQRVRQLDACVNQLEHELGRTPTMEELAESSGLSEKDVQQGMEAMQNQLAIPLEGLEDSLEGEQNLRDEPFSGAAFSEMMERIASLVDFLTDREKLVLSLYYTEELNMREVAEVMGVTEGRVSQLHGQALSRLRREFNSTYGEV